MFSNVDSNFLTFKNDKVVITEYLIIMFLKQMELKFIFLQFSDSAGRASPYTVAGFQGAHLLWTCTSLSVILTVDKE